MYVHKYSLRYKIRVLIIRFKLKRSFKSYYNVFKQKNSHENSVEMFLNLSKVSFISFESEGVNGVLQTSSHGAVGIGRGE